MTSSRPSELQQLLTRIAVARSRYRSIDVAKGIAHLVAWGAAVVLLALLADRVFHLAQKALFAVDTLAILLAVAMLSVKLVRPLLTALSDEQIAIHIESRLGNLDGRLINSIQIGKNERMAANPFSSVLVRQNSKQIEQIDFKPAMPWKGARPAGVMCCLTAGLLAVYGFASPTHFKHSLQRFLTPHAAAAPLTRTLIDSVEPGDIVVLGGTDVTIRTKLSGAPSSRIFLRVGAKSSWRKLTNYSATDDGGFEWRLAKVTRPMDYQIIAGDARSTIYHIDITESPSIQEIDITLVHPEYTRNPPQTLEAHKGNIEALPGTKVKIVGHANKHLKIAELLRSKRDSIRLEIQRSGVRDDVTGEFTVEGNETWWFRLEDVTGHPNVAPVQYAVIALKDRPPAVQVISQNEEVKLTPADSTTLTFSATDDYGLKNASLKLERFRAFDQSQVGLPKRKQPIAENPTQHSGKFVLSMEKLKVADGDKLWYRIEVEDALGQKGTSSTQSIIIVRPSQQDSADVNNEKAAIELLKELVARQVKNRTSVNEIIDELGLIPLIDRIDKVMAEQVAIGKTTKGLSEKLARFKRQLQRLVKEEMEDAVAALDDASKARRESSQRRHLIETTLIQEEIIKKLSRLAGIAKSRANSSKKKGDSTDIETPNDIDSQKAIDAFKDKLTEFYKEQKANILETQKALALPPDSTEFEEQMRKVIERQRIARKLARQAKDQTHVLDEKEITNPQLIERMESVFRAASDALKSAEAKDVRRTLLKEEMAVLMSDAIPNNGEAFLGSGAGKTKWDFEDWPEEERPETKLPPIPPDLHDTLGELIDKQEQLADDEDDMQSQMQYGATDNTGMIGGDGGPLSNMMAKGRSGNTTPKNNEVGGRAGSGRTGKSSGEFVEDTDVAKEGRETEDRYTKEQSTEGFVKTKGKKKRAGGSTSTGGKRSNEATELGLRGDAPINWSQQRIKLKEKQNDLQLKMERFANRLRKIMGAADFDINAALLLMQEVKEELNGGNYDHAVRKQIATIWHLKQLQRRMRSFGMDTDEDEKASEKTARRIRADDPLHEKYPDEYRKLLQEYYRALSEATNQ